MEGIETKTNESNEEKIESVETRENKVGAAEKSVSGYFDAKMSAALDRIAESPYFRGVEERS